MLESELSVARGIAERKGLEVNGFTAGRRDRLLLESLSLMRPALAGALGSWVGKETSEAVLETPAPLGRLSNDDSWIGEGREFGLSAPVMITGEAEALSVARPLLLR